MVKDYLPRLENHKQDPTEDSVEIEEVRFLTKKDVF